MTPVDYLFRLDADSLIGTGHLMRCLAIADALARDGVRCGFLCHPLDDALQRLLAHHLLLTLHDDEEIWTHLAKYQPEVLIVDHYDLDASFEHRARAWVKRLLVLDDLADRPHEADFLLDQGPLRTVADYQPRVNENCRLLLGADYALLRPEFRHRRQTTTRTFQRGLINFGGADPAHACLTTLQSLQHTPWLTRCHWTLLAGAANPDWEKLTLWLKQHPAQVTLRRHCDDVATLLAEHDFAIGAAGGMMWERCCIGLPTLSVPIADNQQFNDQVIAHFDLGERLTLTALNQPAELNDALQRLQQGAEHYRKQGQKLVDGQGLSRLVNILRNER